MIKAWVMLVCIGHADHVCHTAALADNVTFASKDQCLRQIMERFPGGPGAGPIHCEEINITETAKHPPAGTACVILGSDAGGVYDDAGNCIVPFKYTRPNGAE
jgi:hypothetical protein